jgi:2-oxoglutarate ferredoxin oxidoreductase subunit beta
MTNNNIKTSIQPTWCPGCPNFLILEAVNKTLQNLIKQGWKKEDFCMTTDIGCNSKIFDYLDISGIYGLHGRSAATALGVKLGNPNLKVLAFQGDGAAYAEGMEHFIHSCRYNSDFTLIVHDNQAFSLTTGQSTPTAEQGFKTKTEPLGEFNKPLNPIKLALASGATFIARCNPFDLQETQRILEAAIKHKGFAFVEIMQKCLIFHPDMQNLYKEMYKIEDNKDKKKAEQYADEFDYNTKKGKIPVGILFQTQEPTLEEKWPQLKKRLK